MKNFVLLIAGILLLSCNSNKTLQLEADEAIPNTRLELLTLPDSLGSIEILVPNRYDTFFNWTHFSDCTGCGWRKYRFQSKNLPIFEESGWLWDDLADSVDRFTISHSDYTEKTPWKDNRIDSTSQSIARIRLQHLLASAKVDDDFRYVTIDTVQQINGKWFSIFAGESYDSSSKIFSKYLIGVSSIRFNEIDFKFQMRTKNNDSISKHFIENSMKLIKKIRIKNGI